VLIVLGDAAEVAKLQHRAQPHRGIHYRGAWTG
jgi:hypothetical protein